MSSVIKIKKGLDIKMLGETEKKVSEISSSKFALKPPDFNGVFPKLFVRKGIQSKLELLFSLINTETISFLLLR